MALLFATILQNGGGDLSLYHTAIDLEVITIATNGQAIMLFYAFKTNITTSSQVEEHATILGLSAHVRWSTEKTARERLFNFHHRKWPRLVSS